MRSDEPSATDHDFEQVLKVSVLLSGELLLDGDPATMGTLETALSALAERRGVVWYHREEPQSEPTPVQEATMTAALELVAAQGCPIQLYADAEFTRVVRPG